MTTEEISRKLAVLQARWLAAFPLERADVRPLKVNVHLDILAGYPELDPKELRRVLGCWCGQPTYLKALKRGGPRDRPHRAARGRGDPRAGRARGRTAETVIREGEAPQGRG